MKSKSSELQVVLLMEEILHHLAYIKNLVNNGIIAMSTGAGFLPSTVSSITSPSKACGKCRRWKEAFCILQMSKLSALQCVPWFLVKHCSSTNGKLVDWVGLDSWDPLMKGIVT